MCSVNWEHGLNRTDPLALGGGAGPQIGQDCVRFRRSKVLDNAKRSGPVAVSVRRHQFYFFFFNVKITIPAQTGDKWALKHGSQISVNWDISDTMHPHKFAVTATLHDDASRVGIKVNKIGEENGIWLTRKDKSAVPLANTLYDLFTDKIVGHQYDWIPSRKYIFREPRELPVAVPETTQQMKKRKRVGLKYDDSDFIWGDPDRLPETVPEWVRAERRLVIPSSDFRPDSSNSLPPRSALTSAAEESTPFWVWVEGRRRGKVDRRVMTDGGGWRRWTWTWKWCWRWVDVEMVLEMGDTGWEGEGGGG